jgi:6-phosphogluconolactonase (cycloisomerase 2 family)
MKVTFPAALAVGFALLFGGTAMASTGAVYTETNSATGNAVHRLDRAADGSLTWVATYRTGGAGTSAALQSQGAVALSDDGRTLLAVDAGSNDVAAFHVTRHGHLTLVGRTPSGGERPVSIDIADGTAYVLNQSGSLATFSVDRAANLRPRSVTPLPDGTNGPAQVSVAPDGRSLVVTERGANRIDTFPLRFGRLGAPTVKPSSGPVPFGFAFSRRGDLVVSEAANSTVSSYRDGDLVTASLPVGQGAACWVAIDAGARFAYTGNATGSISGFAINRDGSLTALNPDGLTATSPRPNDLAFSGGYLYAINSFTGSITAYKQLADGSLQPLPSTDLGTTLAGLATR